MYVMPQRLWGAMMTGMRGDLAEPVAEKIRPNLVDPLHFEWSHHRNCSLSPIQVLYAYGALCGISAAISVFFAWRGAWYVPVFSLIEMLAVGMAFLLYGRHAGDRELIALDQTALTIQIFHAQRVFCIKLDPSYVRFNATPYKASARNGLMSICDRREEVKVGRFLTVRKRDQFASELQEALRKIGLAAIER